MMAQNPISDFQLSLTLTQYFPLTGVFPSRDGGGTGFFLGEIGNFAGNFDPAGDLAAGQLLPINQNQAVFSLLGTMYGGNGTTNFALPNLQGIATIGEGQGAGLNPETEGVPVGSSTVTLTVPQTPPDIGGTSQPFDNYQPSLPVRYEISTLGVFPSPGSTADLSMIGRVMPFASNFDPGGFVECAGQLMSISQNTALFSILGTTYGGDGVNTFALPDLRGRDIIGASATDSIGTKVGQPTVSLADNQTPNGSGNPVQPFDNREPSLALNYLIATQGIFPVQGGSQDSATPLLGQIITFAGNFAPKGWALANGQLLPINQNQALFSILGTTYGGDGRTTFALPDLRDRTVIGSGNGFTAGALVGANFPTVTADQLPPPAPPDALTLSPDSDSGVQGDNITNVTQPVIAGTGAIGDMVTLFDGLTALGSVTVGGDGSWSVTPTDVLAPGTHSLTASETDVVGNVSGASAALSLTIKTAAPAVPSGLVVSQSLGGSTPVVTGMGEAGDTVTLYADGGVDGTMPAGTGAVASDGTWSVTTTPLSVGAHSLFAIATDDAGNSSATSAPVPLTVTAPDPGPDGTPNPTSPSETMVSGGLVEIKSGQSAGLIIFSGGGTLQLDDSANFTGEIAGFAVPDQLDLRDISFGAGTAINFAEFEDNTQGTLTVSDGARVAQIVMAGQYVTAQFNLASDGNGGTVITDPPPTAGHTHLAGTNGTASPAAIVPLPTTITLPEGITSVTAQSGPEIFDFSNLSFGNDTIAGFDPTQDAIRLNLTQADSFAMVRNDIFSTAGGALIALDPGHSITLIGIAPASLTAANFTFV